MAPTGKKVIKILGIEVSMYYLGVTSGMFNGEIFVVFTSLLVILQCRITYSCIHRYHRGPTMNK